MAGEAGAAVFSTGLALAGMWIFFYWGFRDYRLDLCKQRILELRGELFDMAHEGKLTFDDPTYITFRRVLDGGVHFCHRLRLLDILMFHVFASNPEMHASAKDFDERWVQNAERHDADSRRQLRIIRDQFHNTVVELVAFTSPLLVVTLVPAISWVILRRMRGQLARLVRHIFGKRRIDGLMSRLDWAAYNVASE
jgi:hypothetical protein